MRSEDALKHCCHHLITKGKIALEQCYYTIHYLFYFLYAIYLNFNS